MRQKRSVRQAAIPYPWAGSFKDFDNLFIRVMHGLSGARVVIQEGGHSFFQTGRVFPGNLLGHTISVDEMTGIQALEHKYPDKPVIPGKAACMEFEYIRHGTTSLIGFFDVATSLFPQKSPGNPLSRRNEASSGRDAGGFPPYFKKRLTVETDPGASWTFVCDGLNTHKSESLVRFIDQRHSLISPLEGLCHKIVLLDKPHDACLQFLN
mgnify:CR=1 FL=1